VTGIHTPVRFRTRLLPRLGFNKVLRSPWKAQAAAVPGGREEWLSRWATLRLLGLIAPFEGERPKGKDTTRRRAASRAERILGPILLT